MRGEPSPGQKTPRRNPVLHSYLPFPPQPTVTYQASTMPVPFTPLTIPVEKPLSKQELGQGPQAQKPTRQPLYALGELQYLTW
jgi:hypothetical protein